MKYFSGMRGSQGSQRHVGSSQNSDPISVPLDVRCPKVVYKHTDPICCMHGVSNLLLSPSIYEL